jgi:hypothetical protein
MIKKISETLPEFEYYVKGDNPTLLIHSGTHGDEYPIIDIVKKCVEKYEPLLPEFVFVPQVSPSAVKARRRFTGTGDDINRIFFSDSQNPEVVENIKVFNGHKFNTLVSFHEDVTVYDYYIYDSGFSVHESEVIKAHNKKIEKLGIKLLNGVDDPEDPSLNYEFKDGYRKFIEEPGDKNNGMITVWAMTERGVNETLIPEIPGMLSIKDKETIIDTFFNDVLVKIVK